VINTGGEYTFESFQISYICNIKKNKKKKALRDLLAEALLDSVEGNLSLVSGLELSADTHKSTLHGLLGGRVEHLALDLGGLRSPENEDKLVTLTIRASVEVIIEDCIAAIVLRKISNELLPSGRGGDLLLKLDLLKVISDLVDDVLKTLAELELVEDGGDFVLKIDTGNCHC